PIQDSDARATTPTESDVITFIARVDFTYELYLGDSVEGLCRHLWASYLSHQRLA
ncbi:MAG: hypothetical protein RL359_539, partial [Actinomycetota bacterium]